MLPKWHTIHCSLNFFFSELLFTYQTNRNKTVQHHCDELSFSSQVAPTAIGEKKSLATAPLESFKIHVLWFVLLFWHPRQMLLYEHIQTPNGKIEKCTIANAPSTLPTCVCYCYFLPTYAPNLWRHTWASVCERFRAFKDWFTITRGKSGHDFKTQCAKCSKWFTSVKKRLDISGKKSWFPWKVLCPFLVNYKDVNAIEIKSAEFWLTPCQKKH